MKCSCVFYMISHCILLSIIVRDIDWNVQNIEMKGNPVNSTEFFYWRFFNRNTCGEITWIHIRNSVPSMYTTMVLDAYFEYGANVSSENNSQTVHFQQTYWRLIYYILFYLSTCQANTLAKKNQALDFFWWIFWCHSLFFLHFVLFIKTKCILRRLNGLK